MNDRRGSGVGSARRRCRLLAGAGLVLAATGCAHEATAPRTPAAASRPALLAALDGRWRMEGELLGKPVRYDLEVTPVLGGAFTELHMRDVQRPARYEARVFLGQGATPGTLIVHWLDNFGAPASIPHGTGTLGREALTFQIPYPDGAFRDTLTRDAAHGTWQFLIEAQQGSGEWRTFARYAIHH